MNLIILLLSEVLHSDDPSSAAAESADDTSRGKSTCYVDLDVSDPRLLHIWEVLSPESGTELKVAVANGNAGLARAQWQYVWDTYDKAVPGRHVQGAKEDERRVEDLHHAWREHLLGGQTVKRGNAGSAPVDFLVCHRRLGRGATVAHNETPGRRVPCLETLVQPVGVYASQVKKKEARAAKQEAPGAVHEPSVRAVALRVERNDEMCTSADFSDWKMHIASRRAGDSCYGARVPCSLSDVSSSGEGFVTDVVPIKSLRLWLHFRPADFWHEPSIPISANPHSTIPHSKARDSGANEISLAVLPSRSWASAELVQAEEAAGLGSTEFTRHCSAGIAPRHVDVDVLLACPRPKVVDKLLSSLATFGVRNIYVFKTDKVEATYLAAHQLSETSIQQSLVDGLSQGACYTRLPTVRKFAPKTSLRAVLEAYDNAQEASATKCSLDANGSNESRGLCKSCANISRIVAHPYAAGRKISEVLHTVGRRGEQGPHSCLVSPPVVTLAIGPEGGWTDAEMVVLEGPRARDACAAGVELRSGGFERVSLGPRIFKTLDAMLVMLGLVYDAMDI
eukprot:CAMPEP_0179432488 /NCGR_PEP_ID=MMETSP0799-20121207/17085_1 /TAXON_ID=46947 /ORGANISM="Geminigera cryophila, Strain CCMP2564" /LENGTH=564 /DNA_ID=CAMNT_0021209883 /DNA_START=136 /DNA_END=1830 /DNA_ORIENTATION=-